MTMSVIRRLTTQDRARVAAAQQRFQRRHNVELDYLAFAHEDRPRLERLWNRALARALGERVGVSTYGDCVVRHVGD